MHLSEDQQLRLLDTIALELLRPVASLEACRAAGVPGRLVRLPTSIFHFESAVGNNN